MELCMTASRMLEAMLPDQKEDRQKLYRPSIYNHSYLSGQCTYLYNALTRRLARLNDRETRLLESLALPGDTPDIHDLITKRFFVPLETDELQHYTQLFSTQEIFQSAADRGITMYDILPTTGCNARCFYCFEQGMQVKNMTHDTADAVVRFIKNTRSPEGKIELSWFGGEPMLRLGIINRICKAVRDAGIPYHSTMITNGSLFTPELVEKAKNDWLLDKVQVTLDGMGEEHERRKAYVDLPESYRITLENIQLLVKAGIAVVVRLNMDPGNTESINTLYDHMKPQYTTGDRIVFDPAILSEGWFEWSAERSADQQAQLRNSWLQLRERIWKDGFFRPRVLSQDLPRWYCMANSSGSVTILPDGTLSMCQTGCEGMYYGNVRDGITKPEMVKKWKDRLNIREKCKACPYLPECTGFAMCPSEQTDCHVAAADKFRLRLARTVWDYENR